MGYLSPSIITPIRLREVLLDIQTRLPHHLRLPVDPTKQLWQYYSTLGCVTLLENKKLLVLISIPLLDKDSTYEIYQVINLPMPYPKTNQKLEAIARYKVEWDFLALNLARTKFMLITSEEANRCKVDALGTCVSASPIYVAGSHDLCVLELFKKNKRGIKKHCKIEVLPSVILPTAISILDGIWAVATQEGLKLSNVCEEEVSRTIKVKPPLFIVALLMGCEAHGSSLTLPPLPG